MGYETRFSGEFKITPALPQPVIDWYKVWQKTRRMGRDVSILRVLYKGDFGYPFEDHHSSENFPYGKNGVLFARDDGNFGQSHDQSIQNYNGSSVLPSLWNPWELSDDGTTLSIPEEGKHYEYEHWLKIIIDEILVPNKCVLNGEVEWFVEEDDDRGTITIRDNEFGINSVDLNRLIFIDNIIEQMESELSGIAEEYSSYAEHRDWQKFPTFQAYMDELEPVTDDEETLWEQGYRKGYQAAIDKIKELNF